MRVRFDRVRVCAGDVEDRAGGLARLANAEANLRFANSSRLPASGGIFVASISGPDQRKPARAANLHEVHNLVVLRVQGDDEAGLAQRLMQQWMVAGIRFHARTIAVMLGGMSLNNSNRYPVLNGFHRFCVLVPF